MKASPQLPASPSTAYRGRIAPTPSGWLHHGHAATFLTAWKRARDANGSIVYRDEDIDPDRCRESYSIGAIEDLRLCGLDWDEGPDIGGPHAPYRQSERIVLYYDTLKTLAQQGVVYPSPHSRNEITKAHTARSLVDQSPLFPSILRPAEIVPCDNPNPNIPWRFRVPAGRSISFIDGRTGQHSFSTNTDFSDFLLWRREGVPAYELAVVVDDHAMEITEVVRGEDLLLSTARQILLYDALGWTPPNWWHCPLVMDPETGQRLSKSNRSLPLHPHRLNQ